MCLCVSVFQYFFTNFGQIQKIKQKKQNLNYIILKKKKFSLSCFSIGTITAKLNFQISQIEKMKNRIFSAFLSFNLLFHKQKIKLFLLGLNKISFKKFVLSNLITLALFYTFHFKNSNKLLKQKFFFVQK